MNVVRSIRFSLRQLTMSLTLITSVVLAAQALAEDLNLEAYKGKVVYLDFWASWCGPCRKSFPWMSQLHAQYPDKDLVIIGVNLDQERALADKFLRELNPNFPIVFDASGELATRFQVAAMPSAIIIDRTGAARFKHIGFYEKKRAQYEQEIKQLIDEQPAG